MVEGIEHAHAIDDDGISVVVGRQRRGGYAPDALVIFLHGHGLGAFALELHFLRVRREEAKGYGIVRVHLRSDQPSGTLRSRSLRGVRLLRRRQSAKTEERENKKGRLKFHVAVSSYEQTAQ